MEHIINQTITSLPFLDAVLIWKYNPDIGEHVKTWLLYNKDKTMYIYIRKERPDHLYDLPGAQRLYVEIEIEKQTNRLYNRILEGKYHVYKHVIEANAKALFNHIYNILEEEYRI